MRAMLLGLIACGGGSSKEDCGEDTGASGVTLMQTSGTFDGTPFSGDLAPAACAPPAAGLVAVKCWDDDTILLDAAVPSSESSDAFEVTVVLSTLRCDNTMPESDA